MSLCRRKAALTMLATSAVATRVTVMGGGNSGIGCLDCISSSNGSRDSGRDGGSSGSNSGRSNSSGGSRSKIINCSDGWEGSKTGNSKKIGHFGDKMLAK